MNMRKMKNIKSRFIALVLITLLPVISCNEDMLDVTNPNRVSPDVFPSRPQDFNLMLNDLYGRLRHGFYEAYPFARFGHSVTHHADQAYTDINFDAAVKIDFQSNNPDVDELWWKSYENIAKANAFVSDMERYRQRTANIPEATDRNLREMEGQARFIRAWNYFNLINHYGESFIITPADANKMGVPITGRLATNLNETQVERATVGQVWEYIIADLTAADELLAGKTWSGGDTGRISAWAVRGMLGKAYVFTRQWDRARTVLQEVVANSGKTLVPFATYNNMFNGQNEFNNESLLEISFAEDLLNDWNTEQNTSAKFGVLIGPAFFNKDGKVEKNGFGNFFIHDKNLLRFGFKDTTVVNQSRPDYLVMSRMVRAQKLADPRLWVNALQPYVDSLTIDGVRRAVAKMPGEGVNTNNNYAWSFRKYAVTNRLIWTAPVGINMYVLRMADIYLLYAEALANTGNTTDALEYINKVKRRAYDLPVNAPSLIDYPSLSAQTVASDPVLGNDPLKYERWAELFGEGHWWFDVVRWRLGEQEARYYERVKTGPLVWNDRKYALPIPLREINNNPRMTPNP